MDSSSYGLTGLGIADHDNADLVDIDVLALVDLGIADHDNACLVDYDSIDLGYRDSIDFGGFGLAADLDIDGDWSVADLDIDGDFHAADFGTGVYFPVCHYQLAVVHFELRCLLAQQY